MACLDTTVLLDLAGRGGRGRLVRAQACIRELAARQESLATTRFNVAELWIGVERSDDPTRERKAVESILDPLEILDFDDTSARLFGRITAHLQKTGKPAGDMDVLIASVALVNGERLVTDNADHFQNIPGLELEGY